MNYTKKSSFTQHSHKNINSERNVISRSLFAEERSKESRNKSAVLKDAFLVNREIGFLAQKKERIYKKYLRKHVAQYALTVGDRGQNTNPQLHTINKSLCSCGRDAHFQNEKGNVEIKETENTRRLKGLKSCGSNSACPVCASKLSSIRSNQLKELMEAGKNNARSYMMIVSTIPHKPNEALEITLNQVIDMSRYIFSRKEWTKFRKITKCRFVHGGLENMVSFKNGLIDWHPHKNYLLDFDISTSAVIEALGLKNELELRMYVSRLMTSLGQKFLNLREIKKELLSPYLEQDIKNKRIHVKAGVSASLDFVDDYITKWGLDAEMTAGIYKDGKFQGSLDENGSFKNSFHPFNLLDFLHNENENTDKVFKFQCIKAFQEFVLASKGKWWFYFAKGAVGYYNENYGTQINVKSDELELIDLEDDGEQIYNLSSEEWRHFEPTPKKIGKALTQRSREDVLIFIFSEIEKNRIRIYEEIELRLSG
jgi:hypothetical protein